MVKMETSKLEIISIIFFSCIITVGIIIGILLYIEGQETLQQLLGSKQL